MNSVRSDIHTEKCMCYMCGQKAEFLNVKPGGAESNAISGLWRVKLEHSHLIPGAQVRSSVITGNRICCRPTNIRHRNNDLSEHTFPELEQSEFEAGHPPPFYAYVLRIHGSWLPLFPMSSRRDAWLRWNPLLLTSFVQIEKQEGNSLRSLAITLFFHKGHVLRKNINPSYVVYLSNALTNAHIYIYIVFNNFYFSNSPTNAYILYIYTVYIYSL